jgi:hypothetical protein
LAAPQLGSHRKLFSLLLSAFVVGCSAGAGTARPGLGADGGAGDAAPELDAGNGASDAAPGTDGSDAFPDERCNGVDDNGDGRVDEGCACVIGDTQPCYPGDRALAGVGACTLGAQECLEVGVEFGAWSACRGAEPPGAEVCNGADDDCDGTVDDGCECTDGETRSCYGGPAGTAGVGACAAGTQACEPGPGGVGSSFGACAGEVTPGTETCNGIDDDCNGAVDEGCECIGGETRSCYTGPAGTAGVGPCRAGTQMCLDAGGGASAWGSCAGVVLPGSEVCNGVDDDCDGTIDDGCACVPGAMRSCYTGPAGTDGVGACRRGVETCESGPGGVGSAWGACTGERLPSAELCNTVDDDCDSMLDEGCTCTPGAVQACYGGPAGTRGVGICMDGSQTCVAGAGGVGSAWGTCGGWTGPGTESCNGIDDDCDGLVDDGACATPPTVTCPPPATTRPLVPVTLTGTASDADGFIASWRWTLVSAPAGASGAFSAPTAPTTQFTPNLVGLYTVQLTVTDDSGLTASCTTTVTARGEGLRVEIGWNTNFADQDLHLLRMAGGTGWFNYPNDCYYANTRPSWDAAGTADDPRLDIDDVDGYGPENTNIDVPVTGSTYRVGVHHYSAHGAGTSTVTVRIYCGDISLTPVATYTRALSNGASIPDANDFWRVADVRWDGGDACTVTPINTLTTGGGARTTP